jgi:ABC-type multidrug transport system ATPase subunit
MKKDKQDTAISADKISKHFKGKIDWVEFGKNPFKYRKEKKIGFKECSFEIPEKSLVAILGPSGCGKSTLLKALISDSPRSSGKVFIKGIELNSKNYEYLRTKIGYSPQDDNLHLQLTVAETLAYTAYLRLPELTLAEKKRKINKVMETLRIIDVKDNLIEKISGGQRKRVAIAAEILTDPEVLFLDEPTSPLDPQTVADFLIMLQNLAQNGTTVVMVTHKPGDLEYMDKAIFMAKGGDMVYYGDTDSYLKYFKAKDVIEVYDKLSTENAPFWIEKFSKNSTKIKLENKIVESKVATKYNYLSQYYWLTLRYFNIKLNDKLNLLFMIAQAPIIAVLVVFLFPQNTSVVLFFLAVSAIWFGANNAAREIVCEKNILKRERMFNLGVLPYLLSKITVLGLIATIQSIIFISILWVHYDGNNVILNNPFALIGWMTGLSISATLMGLWLSIQAKTAEQVMTILPMILLPQILLAGIIVKIPNTILEIFSWCTLSRWGSIGFAKIQESVSTEIYLPMGKTKVVEGNAFEIITKNFYPLYSDLFSKYKFYLFIDFTVILGFSILFCTFIIASVKDKDPFNIK